MTYAESKAIYSRSCLMQKKIFFINETIARLQAIIGSNPNHSTQVGFNLHADAAEGLRQLASQIFEAWMPCPKSG